MQGIRHAAEKVWFLGILVMFLTACQGSGSSPTNTASPAVLPPTETLTQAARLTGTSLPTYTPSPIPPSLTPTITVATSTPTPEPATATVAPVTDTVSPPSGQIFFLGVPLPPDYESPSSVYAILPEFDLYMTMPGDTPDDDWTIERVLTNLNLAHQVAPLPDGQRLAISSKGGFHFFNPTSGELQTIFDDSWPPVYTWMPDGETVAVPQTDARDPDSNPPGRAKYSNVYLRENWGERQQLTNENIPGSITGLAWSPDNRYLAIVNKYSTEPHQLSLLELATGERIEIPTVSTCGSKLAWSPGGRWLAIVTCKIPQNITLLDTQDFSLMSLLNQEMRRMSQSPLWTPDGRFLIIHGSPTSGVVPLDIFRVNTTTGELRNLTNHPATDHSPTLSPDGEWILFFSNRESNDDEFRYKGSLYITHISGEQTYKVLDERDWGLDLPAVWMPEVQLEP